MKQIRRRRSLAAHVMGQLAWVIDRGTWAVVAVCLVLFVLAGCAATLHLRYAGDWSQVLASDTPYYHTLRDYKREFRTEDAIFFVIRGRDPETNRKIALDVGAQARADSAHFLRVIDRVDLSFVRKRALLLLSTGRLEDLVARLEQSRRVITEMLAHPQVADLFADLKRQVQVWLKDGRSGSARPASPAERSARLSRVSEVLPFIEQMVKSMADSLGPEFAYRSPLGEMVEGASHHDVDLTQDLWLALDEGRTLLVSAIPRITTMDDRSLAMEADVEAARTIIASTRARWPGVAIELTGMPVIGNDEMKGVAQDAGRAMALSVLGVMLLLSLSYRRLARPGLAMTCLVVSLVWTLGLMASTVGHLNFLTITALPMLVGLGIDFGIQVITRYEEERTRRRGDPATKGRDPVDALRATLEKTGAGILTAGLTMSVSFGVTAFAGLEGVRELGILAGSGILLSTLCMLVLLPALILLVERWRPLPRRAMRPSWWAGLTRVEDALLARPYAVVVAAVLFSALCVTRLDGLTFDWNVLDLQDPTSPSVASAVELVGKRGASILTAAVVADDLPQARRLQERLSALRTVASVTSVATIVPSEQEEKLALVRGMQSWLRRLPPPPDATPRSMDVPRLVEAVRSLRTIGFLTYSDAPRLGGVQVSIEGFVRAADDLLSSVSRAGTAAQDRLSRWQQAFHSDVFGRLRMLLDPTQATPLTYDVIPPEIRHQLVGRSGKLRLVVSPSGSVWDRPGMESFLESIRAVAQRVPSASGRPADVTGPVVQIYESTRLAIGEYVRVAAYALVAILALVAVHFGGLATTLLALTPLALGLLWMFGVQAMADVSFNVVNLLVLPLILGIAVANGIYVVRRFDEDRTVSIFTRSTGRAILLSNLAAIVGIGSLLVSRSQAMYSFGLLMALGVGTSMIASLVVLPAILMVVVQRSTRGAKPAGMPGPTPPKAKERSEQAEPEEQVAPRPLNQRTS